MVPRSRPWSASAGFLLPALAAVLLAPAAIACRPRQARARTVQVMPVLSYAPEWASTAPAGHPYSKHFPPRKDAVDRWASYVEAVVKRYPEVEYFEIWNEPNIDWFLVTGENHRTDVDRIRIPAAEVIHAHGRKVVAPSYTLEWPLDVLLPFLHWAIRHGWDDRHDCKLFWYHIADHREPRGVLDPTNLLEPAPERGPA